MTATPRIASVTEQDERYQVRSALEIGKILRGLIAQRALVTAHGEHGLFFVTALLEVDEREQALTFDYGAEAALTERVVHAPRVTFVTQLDHVRIQFSVERARTIEYEGGPAVRVPMPSVVTRLQRREHYRLKVPRGRPLQCRFALPAAGVAAAAAGRPVTLPVYDISCGGLSLEGWPDAFTPSPQIELAETAVDLPDLGRLVAKLRIIHVQGSVGHGPGAGRFGCRFLDLNAGGSMMVQRYINRVEREMKR
jgi:c-di-GMP-binding flagellar brake protein YcgR